MTLHPPIAGMAGRIWAFLAERHPLPSRLALSILVYFCGSAFTARIQGLEASLFSPATLGGVWSVFNYYLILRLCDELKDIDLDTRRFPERPLPSGRVFASDLRVTLAATVVLTLVLNLGSATVLVATLVVLGYQLLMFRFFFIPQVLRRRPLLNLATHSPVFALIALYPGLALAGAHDVALDELRWPLLLAYAAMLWAPFCAWEIGRKLRPAAPPDEYDIYSPSLGRLGAPLAVVAAQSLAVAIALAIAAALSLPWFHPAIVIAGYAWAQIGNGRFMARPDERTARLQPFAEVFLTCLLAAQLAGYAMGG